MKHSLRSFLCCFLLLIMAFSVGCSKEPIRYLSSESCLIAQGTTKQEVLTYMGTPQFTSTPDGIETWIFIQEHKSALKKTPVLSRVFGSVSYDVVYIIFSDEIVTNCQYRAMNEAEFNKTVLPRTPTGK